MTELAIGVIFLGFLMLFFFIWIFTPVRENATIKYINQDNEEESKQDKIDRLISILEGVCDELEDMR
jgi:formate-dependent nitrite reductase membrane component NrfD